MKSILLILLFCQTALASSLNLAATQWCPYTCSKLEDKGIVSKKVKTILRKNGYILNTKFLPWKRALEEVNSNKLDGVLTGVPSEAPGLSYTTTPTMTYKTCIYSLNFKKFDASKTIGVISGYSYGEVIDKTISKVKASNLVKLTGDNALNRLINMLTHKRVDYIIEDERVLKYNSKLKFKTVLCGNENPFYIGLSPDLKNKEKIINILNQEL